MHLYQHCSSFRIARKAIARKAPIIFTLLQLTCNSVHTSKSQITICEVKLVKKIVDIYIYIFSCAILGIFIRVLKIVKTQ